MSKYKYINTLFLFLLFLPSCVYATQGACSWHGGVDCSAGASWDGGVICQDGWRDSSVRYSDMEECKNGSDLIIYFNRQEYNQDREWVIQNKEYCLDKANLEHETCVSRAQIEHDNCLNSEYFGWIGYKKDIATCDREYESTKDNCDYWWSRNEFICLSWDDTLRRMVYINPTELLCPANSTYNLNTYECDCNNGYIMDNNICVTYEEWCPVHSTYNQITKKCICDKGFAKYNNSCLIYDQYCKSEYGAYSFASTKYTDFLLCECHDGYILSNGRCIEKQEEKTFEPEVITEEKDNEVEESPRDNIPTKEAIKENKKVEKNITQEEVSSSEQEQQKVPAPVVEENISESKRKAVKIVNFFKGFFKKIFSFWK